MFISACHSGNSQTSDRGLDNSPRDPLDFFATVVWSIGRVQETFVTWIQWEGTNPEERIDHDWLDKQAVIKAHRHCVANGLEQVSTSKIFGRPDLKSDC